MGETTISNYVIPILYILYKIPQMKSQKVWTVAKYSLYIILLVWVIFVWYFWYKFIQRENELSKLRNEILKLEAQIEINKQSWSYCATNMQLWNDDNNKNREMLTTLKKQYNDMIFSSDVGFTQASIVE